MTASVGGAGRPTSPALRHRPLCAEDLLAAGPLQRIGQRVLCFETLDSTNTFLLQRAEELCDGTVAVAEQQTAGRGRLGRRWHAPRGAAILMSVLLREPAGSRLAAWAGLLAAEAAAEAIAASTDCVPTIRWPNDLLLGGRKVGGVLVETCALGGGRRGVVLGIGINCLQQRGHFPAELRDKATSLELESRHPIDRAAVAAVLVRWLDLWVMRVGRQEGGRELGAAWRARCEDIGRRVRLEQDGRAYSGTALDIDEHGDLIVQLDEGGRRHFAAATTTRSW